jgi:aryl-alcohol dehydrogenase-like predicted oxidoreductase
VLREHGGEVLVFTKCGRSWYGRPDGEVTNDLRPESIRFELERSLKRLGTDHVNSLQPPFSLIDRRAAAELLPWCAAHGSGVACYSPPQSGLLSGGFDAGRGAPPARGRLAPRQRGLPGAGPVGQPGAGGAPGADRRAPRRPGGGGGDRLVLAHQEVTGAIVGARRPSQVDGWLPAGNLRLSDRDLGDLAQAIQETGAGRD